MIHDEIELLKPTMQNAVNKALLDMHKDDALRTLGVTDVQVSETLRELSVQMAYYTRSRLPVADVKAYYKAAGLYPIRDDEALRPATWTLESKHLRGEAVDLVPMKHGIRWWGAPEAVWKRMGEIGEAAGLTWGGRWKNSDCPHFEVSK